jgi:tetratricopeptide (TPR) repeat protein
LQHLGPKDLGELLRDSFRSRQLAERLSFKIGEKSDGNPFFVFEIIRGLREGQFISRKPDGSWITTRRIDDIQIPASVLDLVNVRVADLDEAERDLLDVAACCGFEFDPGLVGDVLGLARIPALKRFAQIERRHRLVRTAGRAMVFDHHQVQEALYGSLLQQLREEYHAGIAAALKERSGADELEPEELDGRDCVAICRHSFEGRRHQDALRFLDASIDHLELSYLNDLTMLLIDRALQVPGVVSGKWRVTLLLRKAARLDILARRDEQRAALDEALRVAESEGELDDLSRVSRGLGLHFWRLARYDDAREMLGRALEHARESGSKKAEAGAHGGLGVVAKAEGRLDEARHHHEEYLRLSKEVGSRSGEAIATGNLGNVLLAQGLMDEARAHFERHRDLSREVGNRQGEVIAIGNLGNLLADEGRLDEAIEHHERYLEISRDIGHRHGEAVATGNLGNVFQAQGRLEEAREQHERCLELARELGNRSREATALHNLGNTQASLGETEEALQSQRAALALAREIGSLDREARALLAVGVLLAELGDAGGATVSLLRARELADSSGFGRIAALSRCHLACMPGGDADDAVREFLAQQDRLDDEATREARLLLYRATGDEAHLRAAKGLVDDALSNVSDDLRERMLRNVPLHRDIVSIWETTIDASGE